MVAFVGSFLLTLAMGASILWYAKRREVGRPLSWGEAMVAATYVFFIMFFAYGVVPHQWLTWAETELRWRSDALLTGPGSTGVLKELPIAMSKATVGDIVATLIYGVFLVLHVVLWSKWQNRGKAKPVEVEKSRYGRPLVKV